MPKPSWNDKLCLCKDNFFTPNKGNAFEASILGTHKFNVHSLYSKVWVTIISVIQFKHFNVHYNCCSFVICSNTLAYILSNKRNAPNRKLNHKLRYTVKVLMNIDVRYKYDKTFESREKGRDLTQSYDKSPYTNRNVKRARWQHKQRHKKVRLNSGCGPT